MQKQHPFAISLVIALIASLALAAAAPAAKLGGKTTLAPKQTTFDSLLAAGVTVAPSGAADAGSSGISFPITGGRFNADDVVGKIEHRRSDVQRRGILATVKSFVVKVGAKNVIRAEVAGGGHVRLATLDLDKAKVKQSGRQGPVISKVGVRLAGKAAKALSATFGLPNLEGADVGAAKVKARP